MISLQTRVALSNDVLVQEVEGEAVLLDLKSEQYFGLNEVGVQLWRALEANPDLDAAHRRLLDLFEVEPDRLADDLVSIIADLEKAGLVATEPAKAA